MTSEDLHLLRGRWLALWEDALSCWSRYVRLSAPRICLSREEAAAEELKSAFAMIRLADHAVVIDLEAVQKKGLSERGLEILAHEIGHHVYCPGDLRDHARVIARMQRALGSASGAAPQLSNLWSDLLINDRLQRSIATERAETGKSPLDMAAVYRALGAADGKDAIWWIYLRTYELLWGLPRGWLAVPLDVAEDRNAQLEGDAQLAARVVRVYSRDWVRGAGRFASLMLPYLLSEPRQAGSQARGASWGDTEAIGAGGQVDDLSDIEEDEGDVRHPGDDPAITGEMSSDGSRASPTSKGEVRPEQRHPRGPAQYGALLKAIGAYTSDDDVAIRYYSEQARPHLVPFPSRTAPRALEPQPEGLDVWEPGSPLERLDWTQSVVRSPFVIPGLTTVERVHGEVPGGEPAREPVDLYIGIDCSGSMGNPRLTHSHAIVAGAVLALSALRAGARVKVVLSGEPGRSISTPDFERDPRVVMQLLTSYLGTGYAFGIHRLGETFHDQWPARRRPVHVLAVTDTDVLKPLAETHAGRDGWTVARLALERARGGGTYVLRWPKGANENELARMRQDGWAVHRVLGLEELVAFARAFARSHYHSPGLGRGAPVSSAR